MSAPVDVLACGADALLCAAQRRTRHPQHVIEIRETRLALANLIGRAENVTAALEMPTLVKQSSKNENAGFIDMRDWFLLVADVKALRAALARIGGAK